MIRLDIPGRGVLELSHAVFDINGTLAIDGLPISEAIDPLKHLSEHLTLHALTAGTHGNLAEQERALDMHIQLVGHGEEKTRYVQQLGPARVVAIGNGVNDIGMLRLAALGIAIAGKEGLAIGALQAADVLVQSPSDAINLLLHPARLLATLRD